MPSIRFLLLFACARNAQFLLLFMHVDGRPMVRPELSKPLLKERLLLCIGTLTAKRVFPSEDEHHAATKVKWFLSQELDVLPTSLQRGSKTLSTPSSKTSNQGLLECKQARHRFKFSFGDIEFVRLVSRTKLPCGPSCPRQPSPNVAVAV
jgi:hypothetical protein